MLRYVNKVVKLKPSFSATRSRGVAANSHSPEQGGKIAENSDLSTSFQKLLNRAVSTMQEIFKCSYRVETAVFSQV